MRKAALLCLILSLALLVGCGRGAAPAQEPEPSASEPVSTPQPSQEPQPEDTPIQEPEQAPEPEPEPVDYTHGLPFTTAPLVEEGETAEFVLWTDSVIGLTSFYENGFADHPVYTQMEDYTGVHIEFKTTNETTSTEQFNLMVASGDYPDMVHRMNYSGGNDLAIEEDFAIDLTPYIEEYAPNYNYLLHLNDGQYMKDIVTDGGFIPAFYGFRNAEPLAGNGLVIRADWLSSLGMEKPRTYDQLHQVLTAFKTEMGATEPLLLPSETNAICLCGGYGTLGAKTTSSMTSGNGTYYVVDGQLRFGLLDEAYKDYLMLIRSWIEEGLVSETYQTDNDKPLSNTYTINISTGISGVMYTNTTMLDDYQYAGESYYGSGYLIEPTYDIRMNEEDTLHFENYPTLVGDAGITITTACDNVELAVRWGDFWYSEEMTRAQLWGLEGESYTMDEDGVCSWTEQMITPPGGYNSMIYKAKYCLTINAITDIYADHYQYSPAMKSCNEVWSDRADHLYTVPTAVAMNADEASEYSNMYTDIDTYVSENLSKFMVGDKDFDQWDQFLDQVYAMGIQDCIAIYQGAYDRYMAK